jgi:hypothetical protein
MASLINDNKYLNYDGLVTLWSNIKDKFVAKEDGKGLSSNDFTDELLTKLNGVEAGAQVNVIEGVAVRSGDKSSQLPVMEVSGKDYSVAVLDVETDLAKVTSDVDPLHVPSAYGVKTYVDTKVADKNVSAEGDNLIGATASANKVSVYATTDLTAAVTAAGTALQGITSTNGYITAGTTGTSAYVTAKVASGITGAVAGSLADAKDVKDYADAVLTTALDAVANKNVGATSTSDYLTAGATGNVVTVGLNVASGITGTAAAGFLADAKDVKDYADAVLADAKEYTDNKNVSAESTADYIGATASDNKVTISAVMGSVSGTAATAGLAEATDVRSYVDDAIADVKNLVTASTQFLGVADAAITDTTGATIKIDGKDVIAGAGDIVMFGVSEYIFDGTKWVLLGDTTAEAAAISALNDTVYGKEGQLGLVDRTTALETTVGDSNKGLVKDVAELSSAVADLENGTGTVKSFAGKDGDITVDTVAATDGSVKFVMSDDKKLTASLTGWDSVLTGISEGSYIGVTGSGHSRTINAVTGSVKDNVDALAVASDVKTYVDDQVRDAKAMVTDLDYSAVEYVETSEAVTKIAKSITQTDGKIKVEWDEFRALTTDEINAICTL